ncbi:12672_t:CDS:2, partial [Acaulospora colombiana]
YHFVHEMTALLVALYPFLVIMTSEKSLWCCGKLEAVILGGRPMVGNEIWLTCKSYVACNCDAASTKVDASSLPYVPITLLRPPNNGKLVECRFQAALSP